jgi:hypothetical protein
MPDNSPKVTLENVRLIYRNFSGREGRFNKEGERQFCAILPEELAGKMLQDGWNIKVGSLDWVDVLNCDLVARGRDWDNPVAGGPTITAWLQTMYITIDEDELDRKYAISDGDR